MTSLRSNIIKKLKIVSSFNCRRNHVWTKGNVVVSPFKDVEIPDLTFSDYMWRVLDKWPIKTAVVCGITGRDYTFEQMYKLSQNLAANLRKKFGLRDGDVIAIMSPNSPEYPIATYGVMAAGGILTTMNPVSTAYEVLRQLNMSAAKVVIAHPMVIPVIKEALNMAEKDIPVIAIDVEQPLPEGTISFKDMSEDKYADWSVLRDVNRKLTDVAFMPYSSGTTGLPKGVELTSRAVLFNFEQQNNELRQYNFTTDSNQDSVLSILPMFHIYGLTLIMLHKLAAGLKLVTLPKFETDTFLDTIVKYKTNLIYLAPPIVMFLGSSPLVTQKHFEHVDTITSGAAPLPTVDVEKMFTKAKREFQFSQGYGLTEASPLVSLNLPGTKNYESVGLPISNMKMRVVDGNMNNLGPGEMGELIIHGPNIMKGYRNNPKANSEIFLEDGWLRTGDVGYIKEDGLIYITDRLKELIKVNAYQVPPAELENTLKEHPEIQDAAVIGIPDPKSGERPLAFVVPSDKTKVTSEDVIKFVEKRVAPYKRIQKVIFLDSIPKSPAGKILKKTLKEEYLSSDLRE